MIARLVVVVLLALGAVAVLVGPTRSLQRTLRVTAALDALEQGLAARAARGGRGIDEPLLVGGELAAWLVRDGDLERLPVNPETGRPFGAVDLETDLVFYTALDGGRGYRLEVLEPDGATVCAVRIGPRRP